jgi:hypothetical protein
MHVLQQSEQIPNKTQIEISKPFFIDRRKSTQRFRNVGWNQIYLHACYAVLAVTLDPQSIDHEAERKARRRRRNRRERESCR